MPLIVPPSLQFLKRVVTNAQPNVQFLSIPPSYTNLFITWWAKSDTAGANDVMAMRFGTANLGAFDAGANYSYGLLNSGSAAPTNAGSGAGQTFYRFGICNGVAGGANFQFSGGTIWIINYAFTNGRKIINSTGWRDDAGWGMEDGRGTWVGDNTHAVDRVQFLLTSGAQITNGSVFSLYAVL